MLPFALLLVAVHLVLPQSPMQGGPSCVPSWTPTFGGSPGTDGAILDVAIFDDGSGPALYAAGDFESAGGVHAGGVARWDGHAWQALGAEGGPDPYGRVFALAVFNDGSGPALFAAGEFDFVGEQTVNSIAKWDGSRWSSLRTGVAHENWTEFPYINALCVFDDGRGPALYAAGWFTHAGDVAARNIARWDGSEWTPLGEGIEVLSSFDYVSSTALEVFDDGSGPALIVGGYLAAAGGVPVSNIAKWDGKTWGTLGAGLDAGVRALLAYEGEGGPVLYTGGSFITAGGVLVNHIAKWDGSSWSALADDEVPSRIGTDHDVYELSLFKDEDGTSICLGGRFATAGGVQTGGLAKWNGTSWASFGSELQLGWVAAILQEDASRGSSLYAAGAGMPFRHIARWAEGEWHALGRGLDGQVLALTTFDDGSGPALYAGGGFRTAAGDLSLGNVAKWDGRTWSPLGQGLAGGGFFGVAALAVYDDGTGPALYAGGGFTAAGGEPAGGIAKWDGSSWAPLPFEDFPAPPAGSVVHALCSFDSGNGSQLYVAGHFVSGRHIASWDGSRWWDLGFPGGVSGGLESVVWSLEVFDDGGGDALYVAGDFAEADGLPLPGFGKWDGAAWSAVPGGSGPIIQTMKTFADGNGPALYVGGWGGASRWDGTDWNWIASGLVQAFTVHDDGTGPSLYAGGVLLPLGGGSPSSIARWDGTRLSSIAKGLDSCYALLGRAEADGPALYAAGSSFEIGDSYLSRWGCPDTAPPTIQCPSGVFALDPANTPPGERVDFTVTATDDHDAFPTLVCRPASGTEFPRGTTWVTCTATDLTGNSTICRFAVVVGVEARQSFQQRR